MTEALWIGALVVGVAVLVAGEFAGKLALRIPSKVVASTAFIGLAWSHGSLGGDVGPALLAALCLCWLGDVLLLGTSRPMFLGGLVAFLMGHLGFVAAFQIAGLEVGWAGLGLLIAAAPGVFVWRWLRPTLPDKMVKPVLAYMVVISLMVGGAVGRFAADAPPRVLIAAVLFYVSDLAVARNRFVAPGPWNRAVGLPLYYGAMALLALGV